MRKLVFISVAVFLFGAGACVSFCQPIDVTKVLYEFIGEWETSYEVTGGEVSGMVKERITVVGANNNEYLWIHLYGWMAKDSAEHHWTEDEFLTYDFSEKGLAGFYISSNGADWSETLKGDFEEGSNMLIREGESRVSKTKITWDVKDGKLYRTIEDTDKRDKKKYKIERVFTKLK